MKSLFLSLILSHFFQLQAQHVQSDTVLHTLPVVSINAPSNGTTFTSPASFSLNAIANDEDGIAKVEFFNGTTLLGSATTSPYSFNWSNVLEGIYKVSAKATDNLGASASSAIVVVIVTQTAVNQLPAVVLTTPENTATVNAPATVSMSADATDADGFISRVEFYNGTLLLGVDHTAPYNYIWDKVEAGVYYLSAKAIDNQESSRNSRTVMVTVVSVTNGVCSDLKPYKENGGYVAKSKVRNNNYLYECQRWPFSGWCNGSAWAYAPGEGAYWMDAWTLVGSCSSTGGSPTLQAAVLEELTVVPNPVLSAATLHLVLNESEQVSIKLYDRYSQYIATIVEGNLVAGYYDFPLNMEGFQKGSYLLKSITHADSKVIRIEKTE